MDEEKYSEIQSEIPSDNVETDDEYLEEAEDEEVGGEDRTESIADAILGGFSAETNVTRLSKITKLPAHISTYFIALIYFVVGVLCVSITGKITEILPYIVGGMMALIGFLRFLVALVTHEYRHTKTNVTAMSLIVMSLGIMILIQQIQPENESAITFISIVWGILGLMEGAHALNHAFERISNSERCIYFLIRGIVELVVAFMLLYDPGNHETHHFHIIVFGLNLILDSITMIPQVKVFLSTK